MDLDNDESVNDPFGHAVGDRVLTRAAHTLRDGTRDGDLLVRLGCEEFALFTLVASELELHAIAERLRRSRENDDAQPSVTRSYRGIFGAQERRLARR
jgi:diguanylate cyclase (GGDEF)-like protein